MRVIVINNISRPQNFTRRLSSRAILVPPHIKFLMATFKMVNVGIVVWLLMYSYSFYCSNPAMMCMRTDCVIVFMCSLSTSVDVGLVDSVKQHWHVDDSRIYTWKETCSGQITMQSILYYLDVLCSQLR